MRASLSVLRRAGPFLCRNCVLLPGCETAGGCLIQRMCLRTCLWDVAPAEHSLLGSSGYASLVQARHGMWLLFQHEGGSHLSL